MFVTSQISRQGLAKVSQTFSLYNVVQFERDFAKLPTSTKKKAIATLEKFVKNPQNPTLQNHGLSGKWRGHFSINVTGDTRAVYFVIESDDVIRFVAIGSHSELYG